MKINNALIRTFNPCYDPNEVVTDESELLEPIEWIEKYRGELPDKDIVWLLCRNEFLSEKQLRLFAVWCARETLKLVENPDSRSINACDVAERYAYGEATCEELRVARDAAYAAAINIVGTDYADAANSAAAIDPVDAATCAGDNYTVTDGNTARKLQVNKLIEMLGG